MKILLMKIVMILAMLLSLLPAFAYDFEVDGIYYYIQSLENLTCGVMYGEKPYEGNLIIPENVTYKGHSFTVTEIGRMGEYGNSTLKSVKIPATVNSIGLCAFLYFTELSTINIPNTVSRIDSNAFCGCAISSILIPESVIEIGTYAFSYSKLTEIEIPNSVKNLGECAFMGCDRLKKISLSQNIKIIDRGLFYGCHALESLEIPGSVSLIEQSSIMHDKTFPWAKYREKQNPEEFNYTFYECENLKKLRINPSKTHLTVRNTFEYIQYWYDYGFNYWTETVLELDINSEDVSTSKEDSFENIELLKIGNVNNIKWLGDMKKRVNLKTIECTALTPPELTEFSNIQYMNIEVYVPALSLEKYKKAPGWKLFWNLKTFNSDSEVNPINDKNASNIVESIYSIQGNLLFQNCEMEDIKKLPKGIYVVVTNDGTKKIVI